MIATKLIGFEDLPQTLPHYCLESFRRNNKSDALCFKVDDAWERISGGCHLNRAIQELIETAGFRIERTPHSNVQHVIVPMPKGIGTLAEDGAVLLRREVGVVVVVAGGEFGLAG